MNAYIRIDREVSHYAGGGARYRVFCGDDVLIESCREPLYDGARALLDAGADVDAIVLLGRRGNEGYDIRGRLGYLATHTITEGQAMTPRAVPWAPHPGSFTDDQD